MKEAMKFEDHVVLKEVRPMDDSESGVKQIMFLVALPDRGEGYTTPQLIYALKRELIAAKKAISNAWVGANVFVCGPLTAGMELTIADKLRNYRNVFRQMGATNEFVLVAGIDPDPDMANATTVELDSALTGYGRAL